MPDIDDKCGKCKLLLNPNESVIICSGTCGNIYHCKCSSLTTKDISLIENCKGLKWFCDDCLVQYENIVNINAQFNKFKLEITEQLTEFRNVINDNSSVKTNEKFVSNSTSFAKIAAGEVVIVKPKNKQESKKTKEAIQKNLKPAALEVGITQIKDIKEGGVVIKCKNKEEQDKLKKAAEKKLTKNYQITAPELKNPCIKIVDIEEDYQNEDLLNYIKRQNLNVQHDSLHMEVKVFKKMKKNYMAIVECDPVTQKMILDEKFVYINWSRCRVFEYISVFRCFRCGGFNHHAENCETEEKCLKCSGSNHNSENCENEMKCPNCLEVNNKFKLDLNVHHYVFDNSCPVYLKKVELARQKIKQLSE